MKRGDDTREAILQAGLDMAREGGLSAVTARGVATAVDRAHTGIRYYFQGEGALRKAVAEAAIERGDVRVIARLILDRHPICDRFSREERARLLASAAD